MSSGIRWESALPWPRSDDTFTYYGVDLREIALHRTRIEQPPGREWHYNNYNPLLVGMVLELERPGRFYALGNLGEYIYVAPDTDTVVVRLGRRRGVDTPHLASHLRAIADRFADRS